MNNIDILEEYIKELNKNKKIAPSAYDTGFGKYWSDFGVAIEALIAENKELKEKNNELEVINKMQEYRINEMDIPKSVAKQKERKAYIKGTNDADELCNKKWEDKIKAKIEEVKKDENISISDFQEYAQDYTIEKLQSLLGKE